ILWKVIPTFASLFAGLGAELPLPTRIVIALSDGLVRFGPFLLVGIGAGVWGVKAYYQTPGGRHAIDGLILKMPVFGVLMRKIAVARFCRTLSTLLASGVAILVAVAGLLTLLEPLMIAFLGGIVGGIVIAMYLPIFGLISKLTG